MGFWGVLLCSCSIRMVRFSDALLRAPGACHFRLQLTRFRFRAPSRRCSEFMVFLCVRNIRRDEARSSSIVYVQRPNAPKNRTASAKIHVAGQKNLFLPFAGHVHRRRVGFRDAPYSDIVIRRFDRDGVDLGDQVRASDVWDGAARKSYGLYRPRGP
jgi:hypothetical protein